MTIQIIRQYWHPKLQVDVTEYAGLSTDVKPVVLTEGSTFHESDTGDDYISGALGWTAKPAAAALSVAFSGAIPAGTNNIGKVVIEGEIPAGTMNIGKVTIEGEIPAGTKKIGDVSVDALPGTVEADIAAMKGKIDTIQADIATIKTTGTPVSAELPAGTKNIGDVDVLTLPGTVQADIGTLKDDTALIKADVATAQDDLALIKTSVAGATPAGEAHIGEVGGNTALQSITPVVTAGAYHANDIIGGTGAGAGLGINTLANAVRVSGGTGIIQSLVISDLAAQNAVLEIYLFSANPAAGTYTDNGALDIHDTDALLCIGRIDVAASDYKSLADNSIACVLSIGLPIKVAATSLFVIIRTTGTPTYASTSDLKLTFGLLRD